MLCTQSSGGRKNAKTPPLQGFEEYNRRLPDPMANPPRGDLYRTKDDDDSEGRTGYRHLLS